MSSKAPTGRPTHTWLNATATAALPIGTVVSIETYGRHTTRTTARLTATHPEQLTLMTTTGALTMNTDSIKRARVVPALYEPGDPVLARHVPADTWRAGVVRSDGTRVLVETLLGFQWMDEADLEPAAARDAVLPRLRRGPVPAGA